MMAVSSQTRGSAIEQLVFLEHRNHELEDRIEALTRERDEARAALERDRSIVISTVNDTTAVIKGRAWLLEGRGPYSWDDDRYRDEFSAALSALAVPLEKLRRIGADWSNCPTDPEEIAAARTDWRARAFAVEAERDEARAAIAAFHAEFMKSNPSTTDLPGHGEEREDYRQRGRIAMWEDLHPAVQHLSQSQKEV